MRLSRIIMALTVGLAVAAVPTAAGAAQPQPPVYAPKESLTLSPLAFCLGGTFTLVGSNFASNESVRIDVEISGLPAAAPAEGTARRSDGSTVAMAPVAYTPNRAQPQPAPTTFTVTADGAGNFTVPYRPTRPGGYTFTATGLTSDLKASATGTVCPPKPTRPPHKGGLPVTGDSIGTPLKLGGGLAAAGAVLLLASMAWRRRRLG
ncbi:hypothetical protein AB0K27_32450 [Micromonospora echinospora]|uniref:Gram-positive cocci surface proteins LPxTG domain-containing protein n=1 Tax=Micromonospora echinospora TaxID=1877 RepID=A0ABR6MFY3_MICEC|nr:hypothetical protein [Micromonospora echinospora]MBB5114299.1 hypothetical protein [Micromonospora echinospora]